MAAERPLPLQREPVYQDKQRIKEVFRNRARFGALVKIPIKPNPVGILDEDVDFRVYETPDNFYYSVSFPETNLGRERLIDALSFARPNFKRGGYMQQSVDDILADWEIVDSEDPEDHYLVNIHQHLEPHWSIWNKEDRQRYMLAVGNPTPEKADAVLTRFREGAVTHEVVLAHFDQWVNANEEGWYTESLAYKGQQNFLRRHYAALRDQLKQYIPSLTLKGLKGAEGNAFTRKLFENFPDDPQLREIFIRLGILENYFLPIIETEEGKPKLGGSLAATGEYRVPHAIEQLGSNVYRFKYGRYPLN